jgi:hypothetical protein
MGDAVFFASARKLEPAEDVAHDFATVVDAEALVIESAWGRRAAKRAASCLLEPKAGDRVLVVERGAESYVLAVLSSEHEATLRVDGDLELNVPGRFTVAAAEGVDLVTQKALSLAGKALHMRAAQGEVVVDRLLYAGKELVGEARVAKLVAGTLTSFVDRFQQTVKRSIRTIEETEQVRAKRIDYRADEEIAMKAKHTFVQAVELVKFTANQIHLG